MSKIRVVQAHAVNLDEARERLGDFEQAMGKYGVSLAWSGARAKIKGVGVSGEVVVTDDQVRVELKLGLIAKAAGVDAGRLQGSIEKRLTAAFGDG
jgi:putative polyhydroxyalkanoate system protein